MAEDGSVQKPRRILKDRDVPSTFADGVVGVANAGGVQRVTFFELMFDMEPEAPAPALRPSFILQMTTERLRSACAEILELLDQQKTDG